MSLQGLVIFKSGSRKVRYKYYYYVFTSISQNWDQDKSQGSYGDLKQELLFPFLKLNLFYISLQGSGSRKVRYKYYYYVFTSISQKR